MSELITVPSFVYYQGELGDDIYERPLVVKFYCGGVIEITQEDGKYKNDIQISVNHVEKLFREIKKHLSEATTILNK